MMQSSIAICKVTIATEKKDMGAASCLHSASLHMNTVELQRLEQANDKAVDILHQAYAQIRAPPAVAPQALAAQPQALTRQRREPGVSGRETTVIRRGPGRSATWYLLVAAPVVASTQRRGTTVTDKRYHDQSLKLQYNFTPRAVAVSNPAKTLEDHLKPDRRCDDRCVIHAVDYNKAPENPSFAQFEDRDEISVILMRDTILKIAMSKGDWTDSD
ncbi:hypothetical protein LZL87_007096 [Fusarium oxysporum]|nr:hypothetical protein LZL87_007096 [Fusarium oxysporum]